MTDQKLVDELEKALTDEAYDGGMGALSGEEFSELVRTLAVTAADVVEKAHTPTDDEREALISAAHKEADQRYGVTDWTDGPGSSTFRRVDRGRAGAFVEGALWRDRRTELPEPSAEKVFCNCGSVMVRVDQSDAFTLTCPKDRCGGFRLVYKRSPAPQGEPSDAQVLAALRACNGRPGLRMDDFMTEQIDGMRRAVRAAGGVR